MCKSQAAEVALQLAQTRAHAQAAKDELNGAMLHDNELKIGWGKTVPIPLAPLYVAPNFAGTAAAVAQRGQLDLELGSSPRLRSTRRFTANPTNDSSVIGPRSNRLRCKGA